MAFLAKGVSIPKVNVSKPFTQQRAIVNANTNLSKQIISTPFRNAATNITKTFQISNNFSQRRLISSTHETHITNKTTTSHHHDGHGNQHHEHGHGSGEIPEGHYEDFFQEHGQFKGRHVTRRYHEFMIHRSHIALIVLLLGSYIFYLGLSAPSGLDDIKKQQQNSRFAKDLEEIDEGIKARNKLERERVRYYQENFKMYNVPSDHGHGHH